MLPNTQTSIQSGSHSAEASEDSSIAAGSRTGSFQSSGGGGTGDSSIGESQNQSGNKNDHGLSILTQLFETGFQRGDYHDIVLHTPSRSYRLHRLLLSASPLLRPQLFHGPDIFVSFDSSPAITEEGFAISLGHLYSTFSTHFLESPHEEIQSLQSARLFRSVLASAVLLGSMDDLASLALEKCLLSISAPTILDWVEALTPAHLMSYGPYGQPIKAAVEHYLASTLPREGGAETSEPSKELVEVYSRLPFELFKSSIESASFPGSDRSIFAFTKNIISQRLPFLSPNSGTLSSHTEENVVLSFGAKKGGSNVFVTRKGGRKERGLWKVG
ncbi:hypothetical protein BDY24DRAFT_417752 [Mrakia frigida]|uniref:uncharacterized protein n=1 Tax=Mrakia frigida TaxID=29902 RepID=UPI003FCC1A35